MGHPILSEKVLTTINFWVSNLGHKRIKDESTRLKVIIKAKNTLNFGYKYIGNGRSRIVFDLDNGFVLKIAISYRGMIANEREFNHYTHFPDDLRKHLCPVVDFGQGWIIMKKIEHPLPMDEKYHKKVFDVRKKFLQYGIYPGDMIQKDGLPKGKNIAVSEEGDIIIMDYGNFKQLKSKKERTKNRIEKHG